MTTKDIIIITRTMGNIDFLDFVESHDRSGRLEKACEAFFTHYHGNDAAIQLSKINELHLVSLWRFFVAFALGFLPYSFQTDIAFDNGCRKPWETDGLKKLIAQQNDIAQVA